MKFDSTQTKDGLNKYGNYQIGNRTCLFCKSERTEKDTNYKWDGTHENYKTLWKCYDCNGVTGSDF